jgi:hypothetical protein
MGKITCIFRGGFRLNKIVKGGGRKCNVLHKKKDASENLP